MVCKDGIARCWSPSDGAHPGSMRRRGIALMNSIEELRGQRQCKVKEKAKALSTHSEGEGNAKAWLNR